MFLSRSWWVKELTRTTLSLVWHLTTALYLPSLTPTQPCYLNNFPAGDNSTFVRRGFKLDFPHFNCWEETPIQHNSSLNSIEVSSPLHIFSTVFHSTRDSSLVQFLCTQHWAKIHQLFKTNIMRLLELRCRRRLCRRFVCESYTHNITTGNKLYSYWWTLIQVEERTRCLRRY